VAQDCEIMPIYFALFDTEIGLCGIAWGTPGIAGVQLPESNGRKSRARLLQRFPEAQEAEPSAEAKLACDAIASLLRGEPRDLSAIPLDMTSVPPFHRRVYDAARKLPRGTTTTYGTLELVRQARHVPWGKRSRETHLRSSCHAIGWLRRAARPAASPRMAALRPNSVFSRSNARTIKKRLKRSGKLDLAATPLLLENSESRNARMT
jgi:O6-methylguanine-DNA--protein-cysteine methyltransferase